MAVASTFQPQVFPGAPERMAVIDCAAVRSNVRQLKKLIGERSLIAVVKADAYGHGDVQVARAALEAGADMLGVAHVREALQLREAGITAPILAWMHTITTDFAAALENSIELGVSGWELEQIAQIAQKRGSTATIHLKIDTGLGRNGSTAEQWETLVQRSAELEAEGSVKVRGIFSHLAVADEPERPETAEQVRVFEDAVTQAHAAGLNPELIHLANTPATLTAHRPTAPEHLLGNASRVGLGLYGLSPLPGTTAKELGLTPVMTVQTFINSVKEVPAGQGVSYGLNYRTDRPTTLALVPVGYADGVPRTASGGPVRVYPAGAPAKTYRVVGRIAMDQMVIDLGEPGLTDPDLGYLGAPVVLFGSGENPPVEEWAEAAGTINYEIVTRISPRVDRVYLNTETPAEESQHA